MLYGLTTPCLIKIHYIFIINFLNNNFKNINIYQSTYQFQCSLVLVCIYIFIWCHFPLCEALSSLASSLQTLVALVSWRGEGLFSSNVGGHEALLSLRSLHCSLEMLQKQSSRAITRLTSLFSSQRSLSFVTWCKMAWKSSFHVLSFL